jgi:hypothetical protein
MKMRKSAMTGCSQAQQPMTGHKSLQANKRSSLTLTSCVNTLKRS